MTAGHVAVDLVIQTATGVLTGRFGAREAITILASQTPQARAEAPPLLEREPDRAQAYAELLRSIAAELRAELPTAPEARDMRAVIEELERVVAALD